ncbi:PQQ-dependent sugar dehydrogenase [Nesterenkonia sp. CL21]|uniref:PQQ-dependent sugar dehydrogenase n=1 Tax=Nesterenkonia sp. CL21 TaxID=3064894 RepID=UPI00287B0579|nr:PQQ-dependent sugar dehydrogenase [Nesterenkonia sp. CL21]MDS2171474.1 PQQ-dependent sugar dehydrogenase [Nesterenkonia sp. CL21]
MIPTTARRVTLALAAILALSSCSAEPETGSAPSDPVASESAPEQQTDELTTVAEELAAPWSIAFHQDTALVSERDTGRIVELDDDGAAREIIVIDEVAPRGEGGLLGIAVHEDYLYAYYTTDADNRITRYPIDGEPGALSLGEAETILDGIPAAGYHNGGRIAFGPDGMLYATAGDAGTTSNAQDLDSLSGKILRMTPEGTVPEDNPFDRSLVYSYGHRNPQGIDWDEEGTMYASEFGQDTWDELNVIEPGGNYGWPEVEGIAEDSDYTDPLQQWEPAVASPSGIAVTEESIFIANLRGSRLIEVPLDDLGSSSEHLVDEHGRLRDVTIAPDESLWVLTNNTDGRGDPGEGDDRILRIDPAS